MSTIEYDLIATIAVTAPDDRGRDTVWTLTRRRASGPAHVSVSIGRTATVREAIETMRTLEPSAGIPEWGPDWILGDGDADGSWVTTVTTT